MRGNPTATDWKGRSPVSSDDRRELLRIDDQVMLEYWLNGETASGHTGEPAQGIQEAIKAFIARPTSDLLARSQGNEAEALLVPWLMKIDWALELVLQAVARLSPGGLAIPHLTDVNISGGGICFEATHQLNPGELIELRIILPPFTPIRTQAEVVRATPKGTRCTVAARFTTITSEDRERLIRHIINLQAERLRARNRNAAYPGMRPGDP
ncbi:MAG: PilZ domain-containing protein [Nitrospirota bacterium]